MSPEFSAGKITPFPFAGLPRLNSGQVALEAKLHHLYGLAAGHPDFWASVTESLGAIFKTPFRILPKQAREIALEEIVTELPSRFAGALVRLDPYPKHAFVIFETSFAHALVHAVLTGNADYNPSPTDLLQPMTTLSEAVIEYAVLSLLENLRELLSAGKITAVFADIIRDAKRLLGLFGHHDRFAVFSFTVTVAGMSHLIRAVLPVSIVESWNLATVRDGVLPEDIRAFADFKLDFQLSVGGVTLDENEMKSLREGDIVLLDECHAEYRPGEDCNGTGLLSAVGCEDDAIKGYVLQLRQDTSGIHGVVVGTG